MGRSGCAAAGCWWSCNERALVEVSRVSFGIINISKQSRSRLCREEEGAEQESIFCALSPR